MNVGTLSFFTASVLALTLTANAGEYATVGTVGVASVNSCGSNGSVANVASVQVAATASQSYGCGGGGGLFSNLLAKMRLRRAERQAKRATRLVSKSAQNLASVPQQCPQFNCAPQSNCAPVQSDCEPTLAEPISSRECDSCSPSSVGYVSVSASASNNSYQGWARTEATLMAQRNYRGHIQGVPAGATFAGVGWSSGGTPSTCTPNSRKMLLGDSTVCTSAGCFRARVWR